jgi:hypothetical protein
VEETLMIDPAAAATDEPLGPDQYRYIATHAWWMATHSSPPHRYSYLAEVISHIWVPSDQQKDWLMDRQLTGRRIWIQGSEEQATEVGVQISGPWPTGRWRAPHGDFFAASAGHQPAPREGSWQVPTPDFLASLPRDPHQLLNRLQADRPGYTGAFVYAADALRTGLVPADLRAALYRALLTLPDAQITEPTDTEKWQDIALSINDGHRRSEIFINSANGQFAGERSTVTHDIGDLKAGTVTQSTAVTITTVDSIGQTPSPA